MSNKPMARFGFVLVLVAAGVPQLSSCGSSGGKSGPDGPYQPGTDGQTEGDGSIDEGVDAGGFVDAGEQVDGPITNTGEFVVAMVQSEREQAAEITQAEVADMVASAIAQAGGIDFIHDGQTVVLKPNLVTPYADNFKSRTLDPFVNGVTTDWRVVKAVADLVRSKNPSGKILVMEGSVVPAATAFALLGYTSENFGSSVDELIGLEGASCSDRSTLALEQRTAINGTAIWVNKRYVYADVVISIPTMKTHRTAGTTGGVKNLGIGTTPVGQYAPMSAIDGGVSSDCTRGQTPGYIDHSTAETLGQFIHDNFSIRPADFVVMDGLQGLQNGPASQWSGTNYATDKMNMRLILAGKNAVAVDTIEALVMKCDPTKVPYLTKLETSGFGTTDTTRIAVVGKQVSEVAKPFAGPKDICPGS